MQPYRQRVYFLLRAKITQTATTNFPSVLKDKTFHYLPNLPSLVISPPYRRFSYRGKEAGVHQ